jgi:energy-coupling factor transporter ATP-binding protein EcfA2
MQIEKLKIENFKCFFQETTIQLSEGFNIFVGANNSGKTTALELLNAATFLNEPHKSSLNLKTFGAFPRQDSKISLIFKSDLKELKSGGNIQVYLPISLSSLSSSQNDSPTEMLAWNAIKENSQVYLEKTWKENVDHFNVTSIIGDSGELQLNSSSNINTLLMQFTNGNESVPHLSIQGVAGIASNFSNYWRQLLRFVYRFNAQRRPNAISASTDSSVLYSDASNLAFCINHLQTNDARGHEILCEKVNRVFPGIRWIQAPPIQGNQFEIRCLPQHPTARRDDLAISLNQMGTGIGNVIAILYVLLTARTPQVIAIDEPNSFLHPKALRELMQILSTEGKQHQFILSAHSPDVLTSVNPNLITLFHFDGSSTTTRQVKGSELRDLRYDLMDLGIRMTDLHSRDRVLWVEGQTEELVFPDLMRSFCPEIAAGTAILRVEHTGTFEKKTISPAEVANIYKRLSDSSALAPPSVGILLDREQRKVSEILSIGTQSNGSLIFLDRTMLENYLLSPNAIHAILQKRDQTITLQMVTDKLDLLIGAQSLIDLNGAQILGELFAALTEAKQEFRKTRDVPEIISWMLSNDPDFLIPLKNFFRKLFQLSVNQS